MTTESIGVGLPDERCLAETAARLQRFAQPAPEVVPPVPPRFEALGFQPQVVDKQGSSDGSPGGSLRTAEVGMRRQRALERLRANSRESVTRRLRHKGITVDEQAGGLECFSVLSEGRANGDCRSPTDLALGLERIIGRNELLGVQYLEGGREAARSVGRIVVRRGPSRMAPLGTGFLVGSNLLLTNNHVLPTPEAARGGVVEFNYQCGVDGSLLPSASFALEPEAFYLTSASTELDFTLIAVRETSTAGARLVEFGHRPLVALTDEVLDGESVTIIQHPNGEPKQIALRENFVLKLPETADRYLYYQTDTTPGSSGSPVFNDDWELVALHHSGYAQRNDKGEVLARGGQVWKEGMGVDQIDWIANEGVRIAAIVDHLSKVTDLDPEKLRRLRSIVARGGSAGTADDVGRAATQVVQSRLPGEVPNEVAVAVPAPPVSVSLSSDVSGNSIYGKSESMNAKNDRAEAGLRGVANGVFETVIQVPLHISVRIGTMVDGIANGGAVGGAVIPDSSFEKVEIDTNYGDREGYDPKFLGTGKRRVPLPEMTAAMKQLVAQNQAVSGRLQPFELPYHHFSVVMNAHRKMAFFTAVNIDGTLEQDLGKRENDKWIRDQRVRTELQVGNEWYRKPFDRGHLVRRLDPAWGRTTSMAKTANDDTFHFTNCCPQHARFNQGKNLWQGLENYLLDTAQGEDRRLCVFTGPVFLNDDPLLDGVQVPKRYWKVAAFVRSNGSLGACGFVVSQEELLRSVALESAAEAVARTFQTRIREIERLTSLDFGSLRSVDTMGSGTGPLESVGDEMIELESLEQVQL